MIKRIKVKPKSHVRFTRPFLDSLLKQKPDEQRTVWDEKQSGLCILHSRGPAHRKDSTVTLRSVYYTKDKPGIPKYVKIGRYNETVHYRDLDGVLQTLDCSDIEAVRRRCSEIRNASKAGVDPKRKRLSGNIGELIEKYLEYVEGRGSNNKSLTETRRTFQVYIQPEWKDRNIHDIGRSDVTMLLEKIAAGRIEHNGRMIGTRSVALLAYARISALFKWYAGKHSEDFRSPLVAGLVEEGWKSESRERFLQDDEIAALWQACSEMGAYGASVKMALLTAQRFRKVTEMRRGQIKDGIWDARTNKGKGDPKNKQVSEVPLSAFALEVVNSVPIIDAGRHSKDFVFSLNGVKPFSGFGYAKENLDEKMAEILGRDIEPWQHRDLRRTARSLMSKLGIRPEVSERCLAHVMSGVEGIYDRYDYLPEKREAFQKLSDLIEEIVNGEDRKKAA